MAKVEADAAFDGYYAIVTDREDLTSSDETRMYRDRWGIEESFRTLKSDLEARPERVWSAPLSLGHFTLCYLDLCVIRYLQYLMAKEGGEVMSTEWMMKAIDEPAATIIGEHDNAVLGASVTNDYLAIARLLGRPPIEKTMYVPHFKALTRLNPKDDIK